MALISGNDLIKHALLIIGELGKGEDLDSDIATICLNSLNLMFKSFSNNSGIIPFYKEYQFTIPMNQFLIKIGTDPSLDIITTQEVIEVRYLNFVMSENLKFPIKRVDKVSMENTQNYISNNALPYFYTFEKKKENGIFYGEIFLYYPSGQNFQATISVAQEFGENSQFSLDDFVIPRNQEFIVYSLAKRLCPMFGQPWSNINEDLLKEAQDLNGSGKKLDLSLEAQRSMTRKYCGLFNYVY